MNRRGFLHGMLALGVAPAIVRIGSLMPVRSIVIPTTAEVLAFHPDAFSLVDYGGGNTLLTISQITREALLMLEERVFLKKGTFPFWEVPRVEP